MLKDDLKNLVLNVRSHTSKMPSLGEYLSKAMTANGYRNPWNSDLLCRCGYDVDDDDDLNLAAITPPLPTLKTKMYGHKISFA